MSSDKTAPRLRSACRPIGATPYRVFHCELGVCVSVAYSFETVHARSGRNSNRSRGVRAFNGVLIITIKHAIRVGAVRRAGGVARKNDRFEVNARASVAESKRAERKKRSAAHVRRRNATARTRRGRTRRHAKGNRKLMGFFYVFSEKNRNVCFRGRRLTERVNISLFPVLRADSAELSSCPANRSRRKSRVPCPMPRGTRSTTNRRVMKFKKKKPPRGKIRPSGVRYTAGSAIT